MSASPLISDESSQENQVPKHDLDYFIGQISVRWYKSTDYILEIADLCVEAVRTLGPTDRKKLWKQVGFAKGTFSKLVRVGNDDRLRCDTVRSRLPPHYTMLYEIAKLNDAKLDAALKDGVICCDMQRSDISSWLQKFSDPKPKLLATLVCHEEIPEGRMRTLRDRLKKVLVDFPEVEVRARNKEWTIRHIKAVHRDIQAA